MEFKPPRKVARILQADSKEILWESPPGKEFRFWRAVIEVMNTPEAKNRITLEIVDEEV